MALLLIRIDGNTHWHNQKGERMRHSFVVVTD